MFVKTTDLVAQKLTKKAISQSQWTLSNYSSLDKLSAASFLTPFPTKNPGYLALENNMRWNKFWILWHISSIWCSVKIVWFLSNSAIFLPHWPWWKFVPFAKNDPLWCSFNFLKKCLVNPKVFRLKPKSINQFDNKIFLSKAWTVACC